MAHELVVTPLPATGPHGPRVSVLLTHRLDPGPSDSTLDGLGGFSWPERAAALRFEVVVVGGPTIAAEWDPSALSRGIWRTLFPGDTVVKAWNVAAQVGDYQARPIKTYAVAPALDLIGDLYRTLAGEGGAAFPSRAHPKVAPLDGAREGVLGAIRDLAARHRLEQPVDRKTLERLTADAIAQAPAAARPWAQALVQVADFYDSPVGAAADRRQYDDAHPPLVPPPPPNPHFHERVAMASHYPSLLRPLGLVMDLHLDASLLPQGDHVLTVVVHGAEGFTVTAMRTAYHLDGKRLGPADGGDVRGGFLRLGKGGHHTIYQADVDGSLLKLGGRASEDGFSAEERAATIATTLGTGHEATVHRAAAHESLPALRGGAITVARDGRGDRVTASLDRAQALAANPTLPLDAEDLYQGYRVDVEVDGSGAWRSLCARGESGEVGAEPWPKGDPEGIVSVPGGTGPTDAAPAAERPLRVHEALFSWDGWSLVADRPGRVIDDLPREQPAALPLDVRVDYRVTPGTLPRLRYGAAYRVRARVVDLAGNSLPLEAASGPEHESAAVRYLRHEPVPAPPLAPSTYFTEGESLEHLVIRSHGGLAPRPGTADYAAAAAPANLYLATNHRHVAPPKTSQVVAEAHGLLDKLGRKLAFWISARELGALGDTFVIEPGGTYRKLPDDQVIVAGPGRKKQPARQLADGQPADTSITLDPATFAPLLYEDVGGTMRPWRGTPLDAGQYLLFPKELPVSWLPDPMSKGLVLWDASGAAELEFPIDPQLGAWPTLTALHVILEESDAPQVKREADRLRVGLPPGTMKTYRLSALVDRAYLPHHAWWHAAPAGSRGRDDIEASRHWMVTPWREVTFVHAVQHPLVAPTADDTGGWQRLEHGDTFAIIAGPVTVDGPSTGHLDLDATWSDPVDNVGDPAADPVKDRTHHGGHVAQIAVAYEGDLVLAPAATRGTVVRHELGDTRHHRITYRFTATTRYREYFAPEITADAANLTTLGPDLAVSIKSSTPPAAPRLLYVVPTFRWEGDGAHQHRTGRGLRVWLDRPWWSSGDGELLGVVVTPDRAATPADLAPWVTTWGADPRFDSSAPGGIPDVYAFPNATRVSGLVTVPGATSRARVAGYEVQWDADRKLWYADIDVETRDARTPFVSLALCRWQPESLPGVEISTVVRADFVQVLADRGVSVAWADRRATITVTMDHPPMPRTWTDPDAPLLHLELPALHLEHDLLVDAAHVRPVDVIVRPGPELPGLPGLRNDWLPWDDHAHLTEAELQWRAPADVDEASDLDWRRVTNAPVVALPGRIHRATKQPQWFGTLTWPSQNPALEYRVLVRQYELLPVDPAKTRAPVVDAEVLPHDRRIVFAAELRLPRGG